MTKIAFMDYLDDIKEIIDECREPPIILGFSMGGILSQKIAESVELAGLVLIDSSISREVYEIVPYKESVGLISELVEPAPEREEHSSIDESEDDIAFQKKYLSMESSKARNAMYDYEENGGVSINTSLISCPCLVIKAVNSEDDERRGIETAKQFRGEYKGFWNTTHTGLLVGQRYMEMVDRIMEWLKRYSK